MTDDAVDRSGDEQAEPFGREERIAGPGSELRRGLIATALGAALGLFVGLFAKSARS